MGEPVVLPKFELHGDKPHWAVRAAWIVGGLLLISVIGLGGVIMHHRNLETQARLARAEAIERVKAEAEAKVAAVAAAAKAQREAELAARQAAKLATQTIPATTVPGAGEAADSAGAGKVPKTTHAHHAHSSHGGGKGSKVASKSGSKAEGKTASNKPDAIDELLKKMK